ncbi:MAG TPA: YciI family protein [Chitinophagaceae bacterium]|nr:YciI family protein [Chitinophagaceae bacterium]
MEEYLLLMRLDILTKEAQPSPEQLQVYMQMYREWVSGIAAQNKFVGGKGLSTEGRVCRHNGVITDGPFAELKESLAGFIIIKATDFEDATAIAAACPILGGAANTVEVRRVIAHDTTAEEK